MTGTRKSGKERSAKGPGKKNAAGTRPAKTTATVRGKAADALKMSAEKYKFLIEATNTGYVILDTRGRVLDANQEYVRMTGRSRLEEILGRPVTDWTASYDLEQNAAEVKKCMKTGSVRNLVIDYVDARGNAAPIEINATVLRQSGAPRIFTVCRDITERKRAEEALRQSEKMLQTIIDTEPDCIKVLDAESRLVMMNRAGLDMIQADSLEQVKGQFVCPLVAPEYQQAFSDLTQRVFEGRSGSLEFQMVGMRGRKLWLETHAVPLRNEKDEIVALLGVTRDITERKRTETSLGLLKHSIDVASDAAFWTDQQGRFRYVNAAACQSLGYDEKELLSMHIHDVNPSSTPSIWSAAWEKFREMRTMRLETTHRRKDGSVFPVEISSTFVTIGGHELICGFARDITERKQAEEALRESEGRTRSIIESIPVGMHRYRLESDGRLVFTGANPAADRILGADNSIFVGKTIEEAFPPLKETEIPRRYREVVATGIAWQSESIEYRDNVIRGAFEVHAFRTGPDTMVAAFEEITERKRSEMALKESEAKYRRLYNETPVLLHSIDRNGAVAEVNDHWLQTLGYARSEVIGRNVADFYTDASRKYALEVVQPAFFKTGVVKDVAYQFVKKNGEVIDVLLSATAERDAEGRVIRSQAVIVDVTERKRAEEALQKSEARYRALYEGTPVMMHSIDAQGVLVSVSDQWLRTLGYSRDEVIGRRSTEFLDEQSRVFARNIVLPEFMRTGICSDIPYTFIKKNGERIFTLLSATAERDEAGKVIRSLAVIIDVTERKRAEEALRQSEERFRDLAESLPLTVFEMDQQGRFTYVNRAALEKFGYSLHDLEAGVHVMQVVAQRDRDRVREDIAQRISGGGPLTQEYQGLRKDGTMFPITVATSPILHDGCSVGLRGIVMDLSERKQLEEERLKTQKLESIGTLAGGIAHDFNNLLQGVFGYISMAKMTVDRRDHALSLLERAETALHQAVNLTSQLLTFSKGGKPVKRLIDIRPVIETAAAFSLSGSSTGYRLEADDDLWCVEADEGQITQAVQNIVLNADQAMPAGGTVSIAARNVPEGDAEAPQGLGRGNYVRLSISDSGIGIPSEYLTKIFDPYFTTKEKGSGLGLATAYSIIRNHGGLINVHSTPGSGTTFTLYLPAVAARIARGQDQPVPASMRPGRVLVMDDEEIVRRVAGDLIRALGHDVDVAEHGEQAIRKYREAKAAGRPFDIVILDLTVRGGMGGAEAMRTLLEIDPDVRAIVSSGYSGDSTLTQHHDLGFKLFLKKPYDIAELQRALNALLA